MDKVVDALWVLVIALAISIIVMKTQEFQEPIPEEPETAVADRAN